MRFVRYRAGSSAVAHLGRLEGENVIGALPHSGYIAPTQEMWESISRQDAPVRLVSDVQLLAPVCPGKIVCVGLNYADHAAESGNSLPKQPLLFGKWPSALVGPFDDIVLPAQDEYPDWEVELCIVIGERAAHLPDSRAGLAAIGGYTVINDVTGRQSQESDGQWARGKGYDSFAPVGPCVVRPDVINPFDVGLGCAIDGVVMQDSSTSQLVFDVGQLVAYISWQCTLEPGDLIATGTPAGIGDGRRPPLRLEPGQVMETWVDGIGRMSNSVVAGRLDDSVLAKILRTSAGQS
jgi:2-keto-4-pentenoate hydratase/2-oxohepta-3-ene-1,7-dioic acid hydratase in catechol pathway